MEQNQAPGIDSQTVHIRSVDFQDAKPIQQGKKIPLTNGAERLDIHIGKMEPQSVFTHCTKTESGWITGLNIKLGTSWKKT